MRQILILLLCALPFTASAQFFDFGFGTDPFGQRRGQHTVEKYVAPSYKGGKEKLEAFQEKNFKNVGGQAGKRGTIVVACIVNKKGKVEQAQVVRSVSRELDSEALRVSKKLKFKPATQGKKKVKGRYDVSYPIRNGRLSFINLDTMDL